MIDDEIDVLNEESPFHHASLRMRREIPSEIESMESSRHKFLHVRYSRFRSFWQTMVGPESGLCDAATIALAIFGYALFECGLLVEFSPDRGHMGKSNPPVGLNQTSFVGASRPSISERF